MPCVAMRGSGFGCRVLLFHSLLWHRTESVNQSRWPGSPPPALHLQQSQEAASFCCAHMPRRQGHRVRGPGNRPGRPLRRTPGVHGWRPAPIHAQGAPVVARSNERPRKMLRRCRWSSTSVRHGIERARLVVVLARSSTQPGCSEGNAMRLCIDQIKRRGKPQASRRWHGH